MKAKEVPIGCVIVDKATADIIGRGRNRTNETCNATRHAEFEAICQVAVKFAPHSPPRWDQMTLYVTVEPCIMCAAALRKIGENI